MLALRALLTEVLNLSFHSQPLEEAPQFDEGAGGSQIALEGMWVCQVYDCRFWCREPLTAQKGGPGDQCGSRGVPMDEEVCHRQRTFRLLVLTFN